VVRIRRATPRQTTAREQGRNSRIDRRNERRKAHVDSGGRAGTTVQALHASMLRPLQAIRGFIHTLCAVVFVRVARQARGQQFQVQDLSIGNEAHGALKLHCAPDAGDQRECSPSTRYSTSS
jgi:hypothetical protein